MVQKLKNMKISRRLMTSYMVVLALLVVGTLVSIFNLVSIGNQITQFYEHPFQVSASANIINAKFEEMQKSVFRALSTTDDAITKESIANAADASAVIQENMELVSKLYLGDTSDLDALKEKLNELAPMRAKVLELATVNDNVTAAEYMEANNMPCIMEAQKYVDILIATAGTTGSTMIDSLQNKQATAIVMLVILGVASVVISLMFAKFITNSITKPVDQIEIVAGNLANGNLDASAITYESEDELGTLSENIKSAIHNLNNVVTDISYLMGEIAQGNLAVHSDNTKAYVGEFKPVLNAMGDMTTNVSDTISQINDASDQVSTGATQMAENAQGLAEGATEQAGAVEELTATIENVAELAQITAKDTQDAAQMVNESVKKAESSRQEMEQLTAAMERIDETSKEISNIIAAIEDIATQTNLLSLNASIEAARAGEAGKGFAVVADQIGKLAADSAGSASDTKTLITKTLDEIRVGNEITASASRAFSEVIEEIEKFAETAEKTSEKSVEQYDSLQQVREGIEQIAGVVQNNSAAAEESSATSEELAAQAENLQQLVARFQLKK